ncbi:2-dehydropantoate 2-reductase [Bacillota bacterium Lsc_1132]
MKIGIIGGGAIGLLFAAYLCEVSDVTVFTKTPQQAEKLNENGLVLVKNHQSSTFHVSAKQISEWNPYEDLTIIAVKQYQLDGVLNLMVNASDRNSLIFLQNGMAHVKFMENLPAKNLFVGSVEHGAVRENAYTVRHNGAGVTNVAVYKGDATQLSQLAALLHDSFPFVLKEDYVEMLVNKLVVNAVVNPLTAILGIENGKLLANHFYEHTLKMLFREIAHILELKNAEEYFNRVVLVCRQTAENRSSMLKDLEAGRKTEVEAIVGYLLDEAIKQGKDAPLTTMLYDMVRGKEIGGKGVNN